MRSMAVYGRRRHYCTEGRPRVRIGSGAARQVKGVILSEQLGALS